MRVNIYAEEISDRVELIEKETEHGTFIGVRLYLELPVTLGGAQARGPFLHHPGDDDSAAITFWGRRETKIALEKMLDLLQVRSHVNVEMARDETERPPHGPYKRSDPAR